jgi:hypothetical protein
MSFPEDILNRRPKMRPLASRPAECERGSDFDGMTFDEITAATVSVHRIPKSQFVGTGGLPMNEAQALQKSRSLGFKTRRVAR